MSSLQRDRERYAALKAAGGDAYEAKLAASRAGAARQRARDPRTSYQRIRDAREHRTLRGRQSEMVRKARFRARARGMEATVRWEDLEWPERCPVLGVMLDYRPVIHRGIWDSSRASLDRWNNSLGYVPGNVYVISYRANVLKRDATPKELRAVAAYAERGLRRNASLI